MSGTREKLKSGYVQNVSRPILTQKKGEEEKQAIINKFKKHQITAGENECWFWDGATNNGYGHIRHKKKTYKAHRISYEISYGPIPTGMFVCHNCDNPPCTNPKHLFIGTAKDNSTDAFKKGRIDNYVRMSGDKNNAAKLSKNEVCQIRQEYKSGATIYELTEKYEHTNIVKIVRNIAYYDPNYFPINGNARPRPFRKKIIGNIIREIFDSKLSSRKLAKMYNISKTTILKIKKGEY